MADKPSKPNTQRRSAHDPGGSLGGMQFWDPLFRPGEDYWHSANKAARLLVRMNLAFWMSSAAVGLAKRATDVAERFVARSQMITSLDALQRVIYRFHGLVKAHGTDPAVVAQEAPLYDAAQSAAPHKGEMYDLRNNITAHADHNLKAADADLAKYCEGVQSFNTRMEPVLLATERYMRWAWHAGLDKWTTKGKSGKPIDLVHDVDGPTIVGDDDPERLPGGPGPVFSSTFTNDLHEAHASDKTPEQQDAEVAAALAKERERLKKIREAGRSMIPPDTDAATRAAIERFEEAFMKKFMEEREKEARDYKP